MRRTKQHLTRGKQRLFSISRTRVSLKPLVKSAIQVPRIWRTQIISSVETRKMRTQRSLREEASNLTLVYLQSITKDPSESGSLTITRNSHLKIRRRTISNPDRQERILDGEKTTIRKTHGKNSPIRLNKISGIIIKMAKPEVSQRWPTSSWATNLRSNLSRGSPVEPKWSTLITRSRSPIMMLCHSDLLVIKVIN